MEMMFNQKMEVDVNNRYKQYEMNISKVSQERDDLNRKLVELTNRLNEKVVEVNNLTPVLNQNQSLRKKIEQYDISINAYEGEVNKRFANMDSSI